MKGTFALPILLASINMVSLAMLWMLNDEAQMRYSNSVGREPDISTKVGQIAPKELLDCLPVLPATCIIFPGCQECMAETPQLLHGQPFNRRIFVVLPGGTPEDLHRYGFQPSVSPNLTGISGPAKLADIFGTGSLPRVVHIDGDGKLSFVQTKRVAGNRLFEVVNEN